MFHFSQRKQGVDHEEAHGAPQDVLSRQLMKRSLISYEDASTAEATAMQRGSRLADTYMRSYGVSQLSIADIFATDAGAQLINPVEDAPDRDLLMTYGPERCLRQALLPWREIGGTTIILTARPDQFDNQRDELESIFGPVRMAVTTEDQLARTISFMFGRRMASTAEARVKPNESCRNWNASYAGWLGIAALSTGAIMAYLSPQIFFAVLTGWAIIVLLLNTALRATAAITNWRKPPKPKKAVVLSRLPVITMLVPLYNETAIAEHLLARLKALDYPRELLDVCLILEADDVTTRATLGRTILPTWMRPIIVPKGTIKTKPRAMNYALEFARGSIIGIWDAEDAPAPDQLRVIANGFANSGQKTVCLQGILDYYNADSNWLTRCFTIEYAGWFRVILPGFQTLGLVIPLGGTTLFFRRDVLEKLGGWDAHNVTEDADLGVRLARYGYRTELINTVTEEEANGRPWTWVKQRSRWLKGYAITYGVHMRDPVQLWRDLGAKRFFGMQLLFLGTLSQFALAPVLWTFWLLPLGIEHPLSDLIAPWAFWLLAGLFVTSELVGLAVAAAGVRKAGKSWLIKWAVTLQFYFPLAALAAYKGLVELAWKPFYWDKTAHGVLLPDEWQARITPPPLPPPHPVSIG